MHCSLALQNVLGHVDFLQIFRRIACFHKKNVEGKDDSDWRAEMLGPEEEEAYRFEIEALKREFDRERALGQFLEALTFSQPPCVQVCHPAGAVVAQQSTPQLYSPYPQLSFPCDLQSYGFDSLNYTAL